MARQGSDAYAAEEDHHYDEDDDQDDHRPDGRAVVHHHHHGGGGAVADVDAVEAVCPAHQGGSYMPSFYWPEELWQSDN